MDYLHIGERNDLRPGVFLFPILWMEMGFNCTLKVVALRIRMCRTWGKSSPLLVGRVASAGMLITAEAAFKGVWTTGTCGGIFPRTSTRLRRNDRLSGREVDVNGRATRRGAPAVVLWGGLGALAWAALTVLTGGSSAQADDGSDGRLLDGVGSLVSQTVATVDDTVTAVADTVTAVARPVVTEVVTPVVTEVVAPVVTDVVAPVVEHVAAPVQQAAPPVAEAVTEAAAAVPIVGDVATPVVETVAETVQDATGPVGELLQQAPAAQVTAPVRDALSSLPIIGALLDQLGIAALLDEVTGVVDDTAEIIGGVVDTVIPPIIDPLTPDSPDVDAFPTPDAVAAPSPTASATVSPRTPASASASGFTVTAGSPRIAEPSDRGHAAPAAVDARSTASDDHPSGAPAGAPSTPSSSAASGGASATSQAHVSQSGAPALHLVKHIPGASDDVLPTSRVSDTDVSPD